MLARFGELLRAIASGPDPAGIPAPAEVIPTVEIGGEGPADWQYPKGQFHYMGALERVALADNYNITGLENPIGSKCLAVLYAIHCKTTGQEVVMHKGFASEYTWSQGGPERGLDFRLDMPGFYTRQSTCKIYNQRHTSYMGEHMGLLWPIFDTGGQNIWLENHLRIVLWPGQVFTVTTKAVNTALNLCYRWYERGYDIEEIRGVDPRLIDYPGAPV